MKKYFVFMEGDVCDESDIVQGFIVDEARLEDLKNSEFDLYFGNMGNDRPCSFEAYATVTEITEDEIKVLQKFGLDKFQSGYFCECDKGEYDDDDDDNEYYVDED